MDSLKKIVLAEDNSALSLLLKLKLEKEGYEVFIAEDGKMAIELIEKNNPNVILTDIMMPYISGLELISHVRNKLKKNTSILVFSYAGQEKIILKAFDLGANDFMSKPIIISELLIRIRRLLIS